MDAASYDRLISRFYQSATGALPWEDSLESLRAAFDARAAEIDTVDVPTRTLLSCDAGGRNFGQCTLDYVREFHEINPRARVIQQLPLGQWMHCHEHFDEQFVAHDRFYSEFVPAYDVRFGSGMVFPIDGRTIGTIALLREHAQGPLDAEDRDWLKRIGQHLREATLAHQRVRKLAAQALAGHKLLSVFPCPMWLLDTDRFVYFSNPAAEREVVDQGRVVLKGTRLSASSTRVDRSLTEKLHTLARAKNGTSALVNLRAITSERAIWLHLSLLIPGETLGAFGERPQILATLFDPNQVASLDPFALANMFGLTPTEAKIATQLAEGLRAENIASANGTQIGTVRSQINKVLTKFGVTRQAEVVRILQQGEALWARAPEGLRTQGS
jgi:DNA-binding CsgD family transcriptional regulator